MIQIAKEVAQKLNKEYGVPYGEGGISRSGTRRKYYLCESKGNLKALRQLESDKRNK